MPGELAAGGGRGMLKLRINRRTTCLLLSCFSAMIGQFLNDIKVFFNQRATYRHQFRVTESENLHLTEIHGGKQNFFKVFMSKSVNWFSSKSLL